MTRPVCLRLRERRGVGRGHRCPDCGRCGRLLRVRGQTVGDVFLVLGNEKEQFGCRRKLTQEVLELTEQPRRLIEISGGMIGGEEADRRDCRGVGTKWAIVVSNHRPRSYQDRALTN